MSKFCVIIKICTIILTCTMCACNARTVADDIFTPLFQIPIGLSEYSFFYNNGDDATRYHASRIHMRNGIFTITNSLTNKINRYTSYGELISSVYDRRRNSASGLSSASNDTHTIATRSSYPHTFNYIANVAVNNQGILYIADYVSDAHIIYDAGLDSTLHAQLVRYNPHNNTIITIGQEGIGGKPFPFITSLHLVNEDQLVVVCDIGEKWLIFWYSADSKLLYRAEFAPTSLPILVSNSDVVEIESIVPDAHLPRLYVKLNYYHQSENDRSSDKNANIVSRLYWMRIPEGVYEDYIEVPYTVSDAESPGDSAQQHRPILRLLGFAARRFPVFYSFTSNNSVDVLVMDLHDTVLLRRAVALTADRIVFSDFHLSDDGIVSALIGGEEHMRVLWWRLDQALKNISP